MSFLLVSLENWIRYRLQTLEYRGYSGPTGHPHGGSVAYIPEWELRQKCDEIRACIEAESLCEGSDSEEKMKPTDLDWRLS